MGTETAENDRLAAAWQAGFDSALPSILTAANDSEQRGHKAALADIKPVANPYRQATA